MTRSDAVNVEPGIRQTLLTEKVQRMLAEQADVLTAKQEKIDAAEVPERLARHVGNIVSHRLESIADLGERLETVRRILSLLEAPEDTPLSPPQEVMAITQKGGFVDESYTESRPKTPLNDAALFTNTRGSGEPSLISEIRAELATAQNVDLLCAFVKWSGLVMLENELAGLRDRGGRLRVITTTYIGATERKALDRLVNKFGAEVKVQYDINSTRLHAKSWYFHRASGWDTAYVGSSNLSAPAMTEGVEWNVRLSRQQTDSLLDKFRLTFDSYWEDDSYRYYDPVEHAEELDKALVQASGKSKTESSMVIGGLDVRPFPHQEKILEKLRVERDVHDRHRNLVVAATGTGKTVIAALDYRDNLSSLGNRPPLLFVAHRIEILKQAMRTYRAVLKDGNFGELLGGGYFPRHHRHVFATIQSLAKYLEGCDTSHFETVVIDEFHHAEASSYRHVLAIIEPKELLGLTATPERADGVDVAVEFFDGRTAAAIRLWDALEADLLSPFHYFGISDNTDLRSVEWTRGRYSDKDLEEIYIGNERRTGLIIDQLKDKVIAPECMRAIGFCVSVQHAEYMARSFRNVGLPAVAVTGESPDEMRDVALCNLRDGEITTIFTVDLYNEGIDLPEIDTVLFLRPTESALVFLQQLGRGLRKSPTKPVLTALDFVGLQRKEFRFEKKFRALTGMSRRKLREGLEAGFAYMPPGTDISLDETAQEMILDNLRQQLNPTWKQVESEYRAQSADGKVDSLLSFLREADYDLNVVLRRNKEQNWTSLQRGANVATAPLGVRHESVIGRGCALAHVDDLGRLTAYRRVLRHEMESWASLSEVEQRYALMLIFSIWPGGNGFSSPQEALEALWAEPAACSEFLEILDVAEDSIARVATPMAGRLSSEVIQAHARYSREEIVVGMRDRGFGKLPNSMREGVFFSRELQTDCLLITLKKNERDYSPTTMYRDAVISPTVFHWESQATTSIDSEVGRRYLNHKELGAEVVLFVRQEKRGEFGTAAPYTCLGPADIIRAEGSRPIEIDWRLRAPIPADITD